MLSPPIDNFKEPEALFHVDRTKGQIPLDNKYIAHFYFNHFVSIIIPDTLTISESFTNDFSLKTDYYKVTDLYISDLVDEVLLKGFISNGKLTLLSVNTRIDCDNSVAITPEGELILNLGRDSYQSLGIDGRVSHFCAKLKNRYVVTVNLKDANLQNSIEKQSKLKTKLKTLGKFTFILSWDPPEKDICPSSIAKYLYDQDHNVTVCHTDFKSHIMYSVKVPTIEIDKIEKEDVADFMEWLGMVALEGDLETNCPSDYVNTYVTPTPNVETGQVKCLQWRGLFTYQQIQDVISKFMAYNDQNDKPWISIHVQGFSDAPVTWAKEEQNFFTSGDNSYTIIFNRKNCLFSVYKSSRKRYK